jgi:hypothetical protein
MAQPPELAVLVVEKHGLSLSSRSQPPRGDRPRRRSIRCCTGRRSTPARICALSRPTSLSREIGLGAAAVFLVEGGQSAAREAFVERSPGSRRSRGGTRRRIRGWARQAELCPPLSSPIERWIEEASSPPTSIPSPLLHRPHHAALVERSRRSTTPTAAE